MRACPACGTGVLVPILWGLPDPEAMEAADRGEIVIGGCIMPGEPTEARCRDCGTEFYDREGRLSERDLVRVPMAAAPVPEILQFALSYDGYGRHGGVAEVHQFAQPILDELAAGERPHPDLDQLRAALFFLQRQTHHWGELPIEQERWMRALVIAIGEIAPSVVDHKPVV